MTTPLSRRERLRRLAHGLVAHPILSLAEALHEATAPRDPDPPPAFHGLREAREIGLIQEANRLVLHPAGYALGVRADEATGRILDAFVERTDDPEGWCFTWFEPGQELRARGAVEKGARVADLIRARAGARACCPDLSGRLDGAVQTLPGGARGAEHALLSAAGSIPAAQGGTMPLTTAADGAAAAYWLAGEIARAEGAPLPPGPLPSHPAADAVLDWARGLARRALERAGSQPALREL